MVYRFKEYESSEVLRDHLNMGGENPSGERIDVTSLYFERASEPWLPVMGEYHFSRASRADWKRELLKMKAGGVDIVATYLFWIYHEEEEGKFDFSGNLDIRAFVEDCAAAGMEVVLRIGPWAHGECRNGGFPDWLVKKPYKLRDNNAEYMEKVEIWYRRIYDEVKGLFYKDGGTNKLGKLSTFNESRATGYPNDCPVLSYDFQAPISEYGEIRDHYRLLNMIHMFATDFGKMIAPMEAVDSAKSVDRYDTSSLRYGMRTDGESGFVFVNHHQRHKKLADIEDVVIDTGEVRFPPISVKGEICFFMPFNMKLDDETLIYATG